MNIIKAFIDSILKRNKKVEKEVAGNRKERREAGYQSTDFKARMREAQKRAAR